MRIAVPVWGSQISPVLDSAETLKVYDIVDGRFTVRDNIQLIGSGIEKARAMAEIADILICGALSNEMEECLAALGLRVHPWAMGECDSIIENYLHGKIGDCEYSMPGCRRGRHRRCRRDPGIQTSESQDNKYGNSTITGKKGRNR